MPENVGETVDGAVDTVKDAVKLLKDEDPSSWADLSDWRAQVLFALVALLVLVWVIRSIRRRIRRRRPPTLHPRLQRYGGGADGQLSAKRRAEAARIIATSTTGTIAGYDIVEQVEAVFVDGFRRSEEAIEGLKAVAAMKGANALVNVRQDRASNGGCSAGGDAVIVERLTPALIDGAASDVRSLPAPSLPLIGPDEDKPDGKNRSAGPP